MYLHGGWGSIENTHTGIFSCKNTNLIVPGPTFIISFDLNYLLIGLSLNTVTCELGLQHINLGGRRGHNSCHSAISVRPVCMYCLHTTILSTPLLCFIVLHSTFHFQTYYICYIFISLLPISSYMNKNSEIFDCSCSYL